MLLFFIANTLVFNLSFAEPVSSETVDNTVTEQQNNSTVPMEVSPGAINTENLEEGIQDIANKGESLAYTIVEQISDKSLPVCAILILWGAVLYFILGIRNLYKKRQGLLLMWGAFTFCVIAKIMNFAFWFAFMR